jgi:four helix bundle protein
MKAKDDNIIVVKSYAFSLRCVKLYKYLCDTTRGYDIASQMMRSGTSIGANVKEAIRGQSKADFKAKMCISLKEASETEYWLELLRDAGYINEQQAENILKDCVELIKLLTSIIKTTNA